MKLWQRLQRARDYRRWAKAYREEQEIERLDGVIDERQAELHTLLLQLAPTSMEARFPANVRLIGLSYGTELDAQRERVKMLDERIAKTRRTLVRKGLPAEKEAPTSESQPGQ